MKKILSMALAICVMTAGTSFAQQETAPAVAPAQAPAVASSVVERQEPTTIVTPDSEEILDAPSVVDVMNTTSQPQTVVGQASQIQTTGNGCGCQQTAYVPAYGTQPMVYGNNYGTQPVVNGNNYGNGYVQTYRVRTNRYRAPIYTYAPRQRPLLGGRLFGGWRYR